MPKANAAPSRTLSSDQAAAELGVSTALIEKLMDRRELPSFRVGRRRLIERTDLEAFISNAKKAA